MIYCDCQGRKFPDKEFVHDASGTMTRPPIHNVPSPHFTDGDPADPLIVEPLSSLNVKQILSSPDRRTELVRQLRDRDKRLPAEDIEKLIIYIESSETDER